MKTKLTAALLGGLTMMIIGGCDNIDANSSSASEIDLGGSPLYSTTSPSIVKFPVANDSPVFYTTAGDTTGIE